MLLVRTQPEYFEHYSIPETTRILGVVGRIKAGKDTTAKYLCRHVTEYINMYGLNLAASVNLNPYSAISFAAPLKELASQMYDFPFAWTQTHAGKQRIIPHLGKTVRQVLQDLGTEERKKNPSIWIRLAWKSMFHKINNSIQPHHHRFIITDCRFHNEVEQILEHPHGCLLHLTRCGEESTHESETTVLQIAEKYGKHPRFYTIDNAASDYSVEQLFHALDTMEAYYSTLFAL